MRDAILAVAQKAKKLPIVFSLCEWGWDQVWLWGKEVGQSWRVSIYSLMFQTATFAHFRSRDCVLPSAVNRRLVILVRGSPRTMSLLNSHLTSTWCSAQLGKCGPHHQFASARFTTLGGHHSVPDLTHR